MSWDIFVQDLPPDTKSAADIPADFRPASIGKRSMIIAKIAEVVPTADFSNRSWGLIEGNGWSIEVNIGNEEDCHGFAMHVRGGDAAVSVVAQILQRLDLRALDSGTGDVFAAGPEAIESFRSWRRYRDDVASGNDS